jgi:sugar phosphate isomerase/epimerase
VQRRSFLKSIAAAAASFERLRAAAPGLKLGYDTYSVRSWGWKAMEHLAFCEQMKLDAIQISSLADFESLEPAHLAKVRDRAKALGIEIDAGTGCICPTARAYRASMGDPVAHLRKALDAAKAVNARSLRCYLGDSEDRTTPGGIERHMESTIQVFRGAKSAAEATGVRIALENHSGDMQAWEARQVVEASGPHVRACMDTGNPIWCAENPEVTVEVLGPVTITTHVRDTAIFPHPRGCAGQWTAMGDGCINFPKIIDNIQKLCPISPVHLEIITGRPPRIVPYLEEDFWKAFPKARASEFARFLELVRKGSPLMRPMIIEDVPGPKPPEYTAALRMQQKVDLERSLVYTQKTLGVGIRWRS